MKNEYIKDPNQITEYTPDQIQELQRCAEDPVYFAKNYIKIQHPTRGAIPLQLYPYQVRCIEGFKNNRWSIVKCGRQMGKTTVIAVYLLWFACFHFDKYILVASNKNAGAIDIMNRIRYAYEELPNWLKPGSAYYNKHAMEFDNGSTIVSSATTENTGRGRSISLLMLDELAFVSRRIQDEMWASLAPTLSTGGSCIVSSTPNGDQDLFAQLWQGAIFGHNGFAALDVSWDEHPDRDQGYKDEMIKKIGQEKWDQEYACEFLSSDPLLINSLVLQSLKGKAPLFTDKGFMFWKEPDPSKTYLVGSDVAEGVQKDFSTIQVIELETLEQIAEFRSNTIKEAQLYAAIKWIIVKLLSYMNLKTGQKPTVYWSFENNSAGAAINTLYWQDEHFPQDAELVSGPGDKAGMRTLNKPKMEACRFLKNLIEKTNGRLVINSSLLIMELKNYVATGASYAAKPGATDDLVSGVLIVTRIMKQLSEYEPEVFDKLYRSGDDFYTEEGDEFEEPIPFVVS